MMPITHASGQFGSLDAFEFDCPSCDPRPALPSPEGLSRSPVRPSNDLEFVGRTNHNSHHHHRLTKGGAVMSGAAATATEGPREGCFVASSSFKDWNAVASGRHFLKTSPSPLARVTCQIRAVSTALEPSRDRSLFGRTIYKYSTLKL